MMAATTPTSDADTCPTLTQQASLHSILSNTRRILVIDALARDDAVESDEDGWMLLSEIAGVLEDWLGIDDDEDRNIYLSLYHEHAPKLDQQGVIEQEKKGTRCVVRRGPNFEVVLNARNAVALVQGVSDDE